MSNHVSSLAWDVTWGSAAGKCIALKLADCANDHGANIFPSVETVARQAEVSKNTVRTYIKSWLKMGVLTRLEEGGKGARSTNVYALNLYLLELIFEAGQSVKECDAFIEQGHDYESLCRHLIDMVEKNKGAVAEPFKGAAVEPLRVQQDALRVQLTTHKGSTALNPNHHEPSLKRRRARGRRKNASAAPPAQASICLKRSDPTWDIWKTYHRDVGNNWQAKMMDERSEWFVPSLYPPGHTCHASAAKEFSGTKPESEGGRS